MQIEHSEFQDQLVRGLSHRMNNILTLFHGYIGLLMDGKTLDPATAEGLAKIRDGARAATELMDRTHSLVRPSTLVWRDVDLASLLPLLRPAMDGFRSPKTKLVVNCPAGLPHVYADVGKLKTAILEVVRNACEATADGGTVQIEVAADDAPAAPNAAAQPLSWVCVTVKDDGPGIPAQDVEKVFTPFFTTKRKQNAAGLGLTVALGSVQQLGGLLRLQSEPGCTEVKMLLPSRSDPGGSRQAEEQGPVGMESASRGSGAQKEDQR